MKTKTTSPQQRMTSTRELLSSKVLGPRLLHSEPQPLARMPTGLDPANRQSKTFGRVVDLSTTNLPQTPLPMQHMLLVPERCCTKSCNRKPVLTRKTRVLSTSHILPLVGKAPPRRSRLAAEWTPAAPAHAAHGGTRRPNIAAQKRVATRFLRN